MSTELAVAERPQAPARAPETVTTRTGMRLSISAARRAVEAVPKNTRDAHAWRWREYSAWCAEAGFHTAERGAAASFLAALGDRGHPVKTLRALDGTLRGLRALDGSPLDDEELQFIERVIRSRAKEEARGADGVKPGPLQADGVTPDDLLQMVRTCDRTTPRGARDALTLLLDWWMAGRCSEPAALNLHDSLITTEELVDEKTGEVIEVQALEVFIRYSKADQAAEGETVRIVAPQEMPELCPIAALRDWYDVLADADQLTDGPLLRRIDRHGKIGAAAAGRPNTVEPDRQGGITARTVRTIITAAARTAGLIDEKQEVAVAAAWSAKPEAAAAAATAATEEEANAIRAAWRRSLRKAQQIGRRITGHSMRRGLIQAALKGGAPVEGVAAHSRHAPASRAFWEYVNRVPDWQHNITRRIRLGPVRLSAPATG